MIDALYNWLASDTGFTHMTTLMIALSWAVMGYIAGKRGL
jgi:hypothetical protein